MIIKIFEYGTDFYRRELNLRDKVLRKPLGLNLFDEDLSQDEKDIHIGALGGHSALDVCRGAKKLGFKSAIVPVGNKKNLTSDDTIKISFVDNLSETVKLLL